MRAATNLMEFQEAVRHTAKDSVYQLFQELNWKKVVKDGGILPIDTDITAKEIADTWDRMKTVLTAGLKLIASIEKQFSHSEMISLSATDIGKLKEIGDKIPDIKNILGYQGLYSILERSSFSSPIAKLVLSQLNYDQIMQQIRL
jgi:hypothetical protein